MVAPSRERGLKSFDDNTPINALKVAPSRERGLKSVNGKIHITHEPSLPRGSVD